MAGTDGTGTGHAGWARNGDDFHPRAGNEGHFLQLTKRSRGPSAVAELLVNIATAKISSSKLLETAFWVQQN